MKCLDAMLQFVRSASSDKKSDEIHFYIGAKNHKMAHFYAPCAGGALTFGTAPIEMINSKEGVYSLTTTEVKSILNAATSLAIKSDRNKVTLIAKAKGMQVSLPVRYYTKGDNQYEIITKAIKTFASQGTNESVVSTKKPEWAALVTKLLTVDSETSRQVAYISGDKQNPYLLATVGNIAVKIPLPSSGVAIKPKTPINVVDFILAINKLKKPVFETIVWDTETILRVSEGGLPEGESFSLLLPSASDDSNLVDVERLEALFDVDEHASSLYLTDDIVDHFQVAVKMGADNHSWIFTQDQVSCNDLTGKVAITDPVEARWKVGMGKSKPLEVRVSGKPADFISVLAQAAKEGKAKRPGLKDEGPLIYLEENRIGVITEQFHYVQATE